MLVQLGLDPDVAPAHVDETYLPGETPVEHVERLARLKAETAAGRGEGAARNGGASTGAGRIREAPDEGEAGAPAAARGAGTVEGARPARLVVGGDTVVVHGERVLAKPADEDEAVAMLRSLSGAAHEVLSGLALAWEGGTVSGVTRTAVRMRRFDEATARRYVETGEPMDKAGAYGIQGMGAALVEGIEGDYYSVVGFPVGLFLELLERVGWRFAFDSFVPLSPPEPPPSTS